MLMGHYYTYYYNRFIGEHYARILRNITTSDAMYNIRITNSSIKHQERRVTKTIKSTGKTINTIV